MLWSLVFPLGMYALASLRLSLASDFLPLRAISLTMVWIALVVWAMTFVGMMWTTCRSWRTYVQL
jgi:tellurite resistance protein TehA-like permease